MTLLQVTVTTDDLRKAGGWVLKGVGAVLKAGVEMYLTFIAFGIGLGVVAYIFGRNCESMGLGEWIKITTCIR